MAKKTTTPARPAAQRPQQRTKARRGLDSNPRPRGDQKFDFGKNSRPKTGAPQDDRTLNPDGPRCDLVRPSWNGQTGTVVRCLPCFDIAIEESDEYAYGRSDCRDWNMSDWIRGYRAIKYVGIDQKVTFLLMDPLKEQTGEHVWGNNPYKILHDAIQQAKESTSAILGGKDVMTRQWFQLVDKDSKKKAFNGATWLYFVQVAIYQHNGVVYVKDGVPPRGLRKDDITQILELSKSGGEELIKALDARHENFTGDADDFDQFVYPNPVDLVNGPFVTIYNSKKHKRHEVVVGQQVADEAQGPAEIEEEEYDESKDKARKSDGDGGWQGWKIGLDDQFLYANEGAVRKGRQDLTKWDANVRDRLVWWDNVLWVPSFEEQAKLLAAAFRSMPNLLYFGWKDNEEFFTDEVNGILRARTSGAGVEIPGDDDVPQEEDEDGGTVARTSRRTSASVPNVQDDLDEEESYEEQDDDGVTPVEALDSDDNEEEEEGDPAAEEAALDAAMNRASRRGGGAATAVAPTKKKKKKVKKRRPEGESQAVPTKKGAKKGTNKAAVKKKKRAV